MCSYCFALIVAYFKIDMVQYGATGWELNILNLFLILIIL